MTEKIYGVRHGITINMFGSLIELSVRPSDGLLSDLSMLPNGSSIGIEYSPELIKRIKVTDNRLQIPRTIIDYWKEIEAHCRRSGLKVVYLEDLNTYQRYINKVVERGDIEDNFDSSVKRYESQVESKYIFQIEREAGILKNIYDRNPTVAIIGEVHAKNFRERQLSGDDSFLLKSSYRFERQNIIDPFELIVVSELVDNNDPLDFNSKHMVRRQYTAIKQGRILLVQIPDYNGTWDLNIPSRGLFEVYRDKKDKDFSGMIEDSLGSASFRGRIDDTGVFFNKSYLLDKCSENAFQGQIVYQASKAKGENTYYGTYYVEDIFAVENGRFSMTKFGT